MGKLSDDILGFTLDINGSPARKELTEVSNATNKLERDNKALSTEMAKLEAHGKKGSEEWKNYKKQIEANNATILTNGKRMEELRKQVGLTGLSARELRKEMSTLKRQMDTMDPNTKMWKELNAQFGAMQGRLRDVNGGMARTNMVFGAFKSLMPAIGITAIIAGLRGLISNIVQVRQEFEKYEAVLTNTLGSNSAARKEMRMLQEFATKTPFALTELTGAFVKLTNYGLKPSREEMRKYGDLASSVGKGFDQLAEAIADAVTFEFERLKEFGIKAKKEGDKISFTFKEQTTVVKANAQAIREYITGLGDLQGVAGSMVAISGTLGGKISNMGDAWDGLMNTMGTRTSPIFKSVISWVTGLINEMELLIRSTKQIKEEILDKTIEDSVKNSLVEINAIAKSLIKNGVKPDVAQQKATTLYLSQLDNQIFSVNDQIKEKSLQSFLGGNKYAGQNLGQKMDLLVKVRDALKDYIAKQTKPAVSTNTTGTGDDKKKPYKLDPNAPLEKEEENNVDWIMYQIDKESLAFAARKQETEDWTAFLEDQINKQVDKQKEGLDIETEIEQARSELALQRMDGISAVANALSGMFEQGSAMQIAFFAFEKAMAIATVWVNYAKEASAIAAWARTLPPIAAESYQAIATAKAKTNAVINTGIIAAQAIGEVASMKKSKGKKDGGFTGSSSSDDTPMGVYHANEFFVNAKGVRNPTVKPVLDIIDIAQRTGTIQSLNLPALISGKQSGGYTSPVIGSAPDSYRGKQSPLVGSDPELKSLMKDLNETLKQGITAKVAGYGGEGSVADGIKQISNLAKSLNL